MEVLHFEWNSNFERQIPIAFHCDGTREFELFFLNLKRKQKNKIYCRNLKFNSWHLEHWKQRECFCWCSSCVVLCLFNTLNEKLSLVFDESRTNTHSLSHWPMALLWFWWCHRAEHVSNGHCHLAFWSITQINEDRLYHRVGRHLAALFGTTTTGRLLTSRIWQH